MNQLRKYNTDFLNDFHMYFKLMYIKLAIGSTGFPRDVRNVVRFVVWSKSH